jgi:mitotic spindle assembly checkpoint protein MAD1
MADAAAPHRDRISSLEATVTEYQGLVEQLEQEVKTLRENASSAANSSVSQQVGGQLMYVSQGDAPDGHRVMQFKQNPVDQEAQAQQEHYQQLVEENQRLAAKLEILESGGNADISRHIDEGVKNAQEAEKMKLELSKAEKRQRKLMEAFKTTSKEYREIVYYLTGYKIDALKSKIYRVANVFADSPDDVLLFELENTGTLKLLDNAYSATLSDLVELYLKANDSYAAFTAAHTLQLFQKSTMASGESY